MSVISTDEYVRLMARFEANQRPGAPLIPMPYQVMICDYWRWQSKIEAEQRERGFQAQQFEPCRTTLIGYPWSDTQ